MSAVPYLTNCLEKYEINICALFEHWLRKCNIHFLQQIDSKYKLYAISVDELLPTTQKCSNYRKGVALLVSSNIDRYVVHELDVDSDRIIGIKIHLPNDVTIFFFCVYLPAASLAVDLFKEYVDLLHELYSVYSQNGIVIFAGDFNAKVQGPRVSGVQDDRSKILRRGYENGPCSTIDHIIVLDNLPFKPENVNILDDHGLNLSDHFPIICTFNLGDSLTRPNLSTSSTNIAWNKALSNGCLTDYAFAVSQNLWTVDTNQTDIEKYYSEIVNNLVLAARDTLPIVKHKRHSKPYWNDHLTELHV
ncbi:Hypothetical predicted protein [Mytilus galloprovincialis]|uniref:Endonuclease/exonuclease/phosphatase domain-containing protein n=1 Tax=Mytilus galloprovincialis TaxID=29158 RepID=A0A8B6GD16_MYTGA|nr:Hypothetical predicted protein [Mytilus galloprovincialis]